MVEEQERDPPFASAEAAEVSPLPILLPRDLTLTLPPASPYLLAMARASVPLLVLLGGAALATTIPVTGVRR